MDSDTKSKTSSVYHDVKSWNELKEHVLKSHSDKSESKVDLSRYHFIFDIDFTTYTYSKRGDDTDMMFECISDNGYDGWGQSTKVDEGTAILMDSYVKDVYDFLIKCGANITFVTSRNHESKNRTIKELVALGFDDPDVLCVGTNSKTTTFFKEKKLESNIIVVLDDESRNLDGFKEMTTSGLEFILLRYIILI